MSKSKSHRPDEHLRGIVRKLQAENRQLKRLLKHQEKQARLDDEIRDEIQSLPNETPLSNPKCPECGSPDLRSIDLGSRLLHFCTHCAYRRSEKL